MRLYKDGVEAFAESSQVKDLLAAGWSRTKEVSKAPEAISITETSDADEPNESNESTETTQKRRLIKKS